MPELFEETCLNGMKLRNRLVRSATWTGLAGETGECTDRLIDLTAELARGGAGLIITGHAYVLKNGQAGPRQLAIDGDGMLTGLRSLTEAVHDHGGAIVAQLAHAGIYADPSLTGLTPWVVSHPGRFVSYPLAELRAEDVEAVADAFVTAAARAHDAGFDGIQLHAAHGYLLHQFLSPAYNGRTDRHGGDVAGRSLLLLEIVRRIRRELGPGYPILVKLSGRDFMESGLMPDQSVQIAALLEKAGVDAIEISGGTRESGRFKSARTGVLSQEGEAYFEEIARLFRKRLNIPIMLVGGIRRYATARRLLETGAADYISMSRPFIREPGFVNRWREGDTAPAACVSDNECLGQGLNGTGIRCRW